MAKQRKKFGHANGPIPCTRLLTKPLPHFEEQEIEAYAVIAINDETGTFTSANIYSPVGESMAEAGGYLGKNYDPDCMTHPLPDGDALTAKLKVWSKKGYEESPIGDFDVLTEVGTLEEVMV